MIYRLIYKMLLRNMKVIVIQHNIIFIIFQTTKLYNNVTYILYSQFIIEL